MSLKLVLQLFFTTCVVANCQPVMGTSDDKNNAANLFGDVGLEIAAPPKATTKGLEVSVKIHNPKKLDFCVGAPLQQSFVVRLLDAKTQRDLLSDVYFDADTWYTRELQARHYSGNEPAVRVSGNPELIVKAISLPYWNAFYQSRKGERTYFQTGDLAVAEVSLGVFPCEHKTENAAIAAESITVLQAEQTKPFVTSSKMFVTTQ